MGKSRVKGIVVEIGGDTVGLDKALQGTNKEINNTQSKLKDVERLLKLDPTNTKLLEQRQKYLAEAIGETREKLDVLNKANRDLKSDLDNPASPAQFEALQREIIETEQKLQQLEDKAAGNFRQISDAVDDAKIKMAQLGDTAASIKDKAAGVADTFQPVTQGVVALAGAAAATVPATAELREDLSRLDANALENAVSIDTARKAWKEFAVQSGETDSAVEAVSNLLQAGFTESNLQKAVEGLAGAAQRFPDTLKVESLADSLQETLATGAATGQFAELMDRLGISVEDFDAAMAECTSDAEKQNLALQTLADAGLSDSYNAWKQANEEMVKNKEVNLSLELAMAELAEVVLPFVTEGTKKMAEFIEKFANLPTPVQGAIAALLLMVGAISPVASSISGAAKLMETLSKVQLPGMGAALGTISGKALPGLGTAFSSVFGFIAANPVVLLIGAIAGLVALVATKSEECIEFLGMVDNFLQAVFAVDWTEIFGPVLGGALNDFFAMCKDIWDGVKLMLEGIIDFIAGVFSGDWERAWDGVRKIFTGIFDSLEGLLKAPINGVIKMVNKAIDGINWLIKGVNKIPGVNLGTIGQIPMLANGGEVIQGNAIVGDGGPELLTVLPDRTVVQPLTNNYHSTARNVGSINVSVYGAPGQDVRELAEAVAEEMQYLYESEDAGWR